MSRSWQTEDPRPPHSWGWLVAGGAVVVVMGAACLAAVALYLNTLPRDLTHVSDSYADRIEGQLRFGSIPLRNIRRKAPELRRDDSARWHEWAFEADLLAGMSVDAAEKILRRTFLGGPLAVQIREPDPLGEGRRLVFLLKDRPIARLVLMRPEDGQPSSGPSNPPEATMDAARPGAPEPAEASVDVAGRSKPRELKAAQPEAAEPLPAHFAKLTLDPLPMLDELPLESAHAPEHAPSEFEDIAPIGLDGPPRVALVVDDGGYGGPISERILALDAPLTLAILPFAPQSRDTADAARARGFEVLLHMPMQALQPSHTYPGSLTTSMGQREVAALVDAAFADVPGAAGVNNHTGSLFTADAAAMDRFVKTLAGRGVFFLDSCTTPKTVAWQRAAAAGIPALRQNLFLDNTPSVTHIVAQAGKLAAIAQSRGAAVGICHFRPTTAEALPSVIARIKRAGVKIVPLSAVMPPAALESAS